MTSISTLRNFCKQCVRYIQQADGLLDTLYVTTNSLKESGILKKLSESKGKNLNTADFTTLLLALMNTPLGNNFFKRMMGGDNSATETEAPPTETPKPATAAPSQAASTTPSTNQVRPGPQAQAALPPAQPRPPGNPYPPYGYPPGSMPM